MQTPTEITLQRKLSPQVGVDAEATRSRSISEAVHVAYSANV